jgi:hypothetical protein
MGRIDWQRRLRVLSTFPFPEALVDITAVVDDLKSQGFFIERSRRYAGKLRYEGLTFNASLAREIVAKIKERPIDFWKILIHRPPFSLLQAADAFACRVVDRIGNRGATPAIPISPTPLIPSGLISSSHSSTKIISSGR